MNRVQQMQLPINYREEKYSGNSSNFATRFGEDQISGSAVGDTIVLKLEELSV